MSKSKKHYPVAVDNAKGTWKQEYNGKFRSKTKQLLNQVVEGKLEPEDLILPNELIEISERYCSPKEDVHIWNFQFQDSFLDETEEANYYEKLARYEQSFRK